MKRGTPRLVKTRRLATALGIPLPYAVGILEMLWHTTVEQAPQGDIGKLTDAEIASEIGWPVAKAVPLITALVEQGWLDRSDTYRLVVHDWHDHADQTLRRKLERLGVGFCSASPIASQQLAPDYPSASSELASREAQAQAQARLGSVLGGESERGGMLPHGLVLSPEWRTLAEGLGCRNPAALFGEFCDYWWSHGKVRKDWTATWRNWVRHAHGKMGPCVCAASGLAKSTGSPVLDYALRQVHEAEEEEQHAAQSGK